MNETIFLYILIKLMAMPPDTTRNITSWVDLNEQSLFVTTSLTSAWFHKRSDHEKKKKKDKRKEI